MVCCHLVLHTKKKNHQNKGGFRTEQGYCSGSGSHESTYCGRLEQEKPEPMVDRDDEGELGDEEKEVMSEVSVDGRSSFVCNLSQQLGSFSRKSLCSAQAAAGPTFFCSRSRLPSTSTGGFIQKARPVTMLSACTCPAFQSGESRRPSSFCGQHFKVVHRRRRKITPLPPCTSSNPPLLHSNKGASLEKGGVGKISSRAR